MEYKIPEYSDLKHLSDIEFTQCIDGLRRICNDNFKALCSKNGTEVIHDSEFLKDLKIPIQSSLHIEGLNDDNDELEDSDYVCCPRMEAINARIQQCKAAKSIIHDMWLDLDSVDDCSDQSENGYNHLLGNKSENLIKYLSKKSLGVNSRLNAQLHDFICEKNVSPGVLNILQNYLQNPECPMLIKKDAHEKWWKPEITIPKPFSFSNSTGQKSLYHKYCVHSADTQSKDSKLSRRKVDLFSPSYRDISAMENNRRKIRRGVCSTELSNGKRLHIIKNEESVSKAIKRVRNNNRKTIPDFGELHKQSALAFSCRKMKAHASMPLTKVRPFKLSHQKGITERNVSKQQPELLSYSSKRAASAPVKFSDILHENETYKLRMKHLR